MDDVIGKRVLVVGGTGFIGSHLVRRLVDARAQVGVLVRNTNELRRLDALRGHLIPLQGDLCEKDIFERMPDFSPEVIFHLAATGVEDPLGGAENMIRTNVFGTANLLRFVADVWERDVSLIVYAGTGYEYGGASTCPRVEDEVLRPANQYAASKAAAWQFCQAFAVSSGLPVIGVRPFYTYGPDQGTRRLVPYAVSRALVHRRLDLTNCEQVRDLIFIDDLIDGLMSVIEHRPPAGETYNLGSGTAVSLRTVVESIVRLTGSRSQLNFGAIPYRPGEVGHLVADVGKAQQMLNWRASTDLETGLERTISWYQNHRDAR